MSQKVPSQRTHRSKGFRRAATLVSRDVKDAAERRGFAVSKVLTHWADIVGPEAASIARPVDISYGRGGFGATLTLLTTGAHAPMLEMQKEQLRERVNGCYGYSAVSRIRITQTARDGFEEGRVSFERAPKMSHPLPTDPALLARAEASTKPVSDDGLRAALTALGQNILKRKST